MTKVYIVAKSETYTFFGTDTLDPRAEAKLAIEEHRKSCRILGADRWQYTSSWNTNGNGCSVTVFHTVPNARGGVSIAPVGNLIEQDEFRVMALAEVLWNADCDDFVNRFDSKPAAGKFGQVNESNNHLLVNSYEKMARRIDAEMKLRGK